MYSKKLTEIELTLKIIISVNNAEYIKVTNEKYVRVTKHKIKSSLRLIQGRRLTGKNIKKQTPY